MYEENMKQYWKAIDTHMKANMFRPTIGRPPKEREAEEIYEKLIKAGKEYEKHREDTIK